MSKRKSTMRGRGQEILGRGVDALFSSPDPQPEPSPDDIAAAAPAPTPADSVEDELDKLLAVEANDAIGVEETPAALAPTPAQPPSPLRHAGASARPQPPTPMRGQVAGGGILIPDEELLGGIDVPFGADDAIPTDPVFSPIDVPPAFEDTTPIEPSSGAGDDSGLIDLEPEPPAEPAPARPEPNFPPPPAQPSPAPRPAPPAPIQPTGPVQPPASDVSATTVTDEQTPPSRPRFEIGGVLTEVHVSEPEADSLRPTDPFARPSRPAVVESPRAAPSAEAQKRIIDSVNSERIIALHTQIDRLYRDIPKAISNRPELSDQAMGMLRQARTILYEKPYDFVEAEYKVQQALTLYNRIENSEKWADKYGWRVFWFEVLVFFLFLVSFLGLLAFGPEFSQFLAGLFGITAPGQGVFTAVGFWATFVWGGIGGVVGAMYILWTHVSERQDFERQHVMWYVAQPIMGLILGGVIFLIINTGLLSLQGGDLAAEQLRTEVQLFPALIAFIAGFRPQFVFGLLVKIIKVINPDNE